MADINWLAAIVAGVLGFTYYLGPDPALGTALAGGLVVALAFVTT